MSGALSRNFVDYIVANIDEDAARLVYADWLEEHGQPERAEFIRVQVDRARLPAWDAAQVRLRLREQALLKQHGEAWLAELPAIEGARWEGFRRGIVAEVSFASYEAMRQSAHACRAVAPVEAVTVSWPRRRDTVSQDTPIAELRELVLTGRPRGEREVGRLADSPQLATLRRLAARGLWAEGLARLVASLHLAPLKALCLPDNASMGADGMRALAEAAALTALEELDLTGEGVADAYGAEDEGEVPPGVEGFAAWEGLKTVRRLTLACNQLGSGGLRILLRSPYVGALKHLSLRRCGLDGPLGVFRDTKAKLRLESLDLGDNMFLGRAAENLAAAPCLCDLKALRIKGCEIPPTGARALVERATFLDGLQVLDIGHNHFGPAGLGALLDRRPPALHTLRMRDNDVLDKGVALLAGSPASDGLLEVDLSQNQLFPAAVKALGAAAHLRSLLVLRMGDNRLGTAASKALAESPLGKRLALLETESRAPSPGAAASGELDSLF